MYLIQSLSLVFLLALCKAADDVPVTDQQPEKAFTLAHNGHDYVLVMTRKLWHGTQAEKYCLLHHGMHLAKVPDMATLKALETVLFGIQESEDYLLKTIATGERSSQKINTGQPIPFDDLNPAGEHCVILGAWDHDPNREKNGWFGDYMEILPKDCHFKRTILCEDFTFCGEPGQSGRFCAYGEMYESGDAATCYEVVTKASTYLVARADCVQRGGDLAVIRDIGANDFLLELMKNQQESGPFIGFTSLLEITGDGWAWVDGSHYNDYLGDRFWSPFDLIGQPDALDLCSYLDAETGLWKSAPCEGAGGELAHVCEFDPQKHKDEEPGVEPIYKKDEEEFILSYNKRKYILVKNRNMWHDEDGWRYCRIHHKMQLARVPDEETRAALQDKLFEIQKETGYTLREIATGERTSLKKHTNPIPFDELNPSGWQCAILGAWSTETTNWTGDKLTLMSKDCHHQRTLLCEEVYPCRPKN